MESVESIVASNGAVVEAGGVYLTFSGDSDTPYSFAKVISVGGSGESFGVQVGPDMKPIPSPDLWVKLYYSQTAERPAESATPSGRYRIMPISVAMFLAWGPPLFPIRVGTEAVTEEELLARGKDWYMDDEPDDVSSDPEG